MVQELPPMLQVNSSTSVQQLNAFLKNAEAGDKLFGTKHAKNKGVVTLYLSPKALGRRELGSDRLHARSFKLHRKTARETFATILSNAIKEEINPSHTGYRYQRKFHKELHTLLTTAVERNIAPRPAQGDEQYISQEMNAEDVKKIIDAFGEITNRVRKHDSSLAKNGRISKARPESKSEVLEDTTALGRWAGTVFYPHLKIGEITYVPKKILGHGAFGKVIRYQEKGGSACKAVKFGLEYGRIAEKPRQQRADAIQELNRGLKFGGDSGKTLTYNDYVEVGEQKMIALIGDLGEHGDLSNFSKKLKAIMRSSKPVSPHAHRLIALTLALDTAEGLSSIHRAGGIHNDIKVENQILDSKGAAKIVDFGMAAQGPTVSKLRGQRNPGHNPYAAPEAERLQENYKENVKVTTETAKKRAEKIRGEFAAMLKTFQDADKTRPNTGPGGAVGKNMPAVGAGKVEHKNDGFARKHSEYFYRSEFADAADAFAIDAKADVYGVGALAYEMMTFSWLYADREENAKTGIDGTPFSDGDFIERARLRKIDLIEDEHGHGISHSESVPFADHAIARSTGDPVVDLLLDDVLAPNPRKRPSAAEVEQHFAMDYAKNGDKRAVGSPEVRALILAIATGDQQEIGHTTEALKKAFPKPENMRVYRELLDVRLKKREELAPPQPIDFEKKLDGKAPILPAFEPSSAPVTTDNEPPKMIVVKEQKMDQSEILAPPPIGLNEKPRPYVNTLLVKMYKKRKRVGLRQAIPAVHSKSRGTNPDQPRLIGSKHKPAPESETRRLSFDFDENLVRAYQSPEEKGLAPATSGRPPANNEKRALSQKIRLVEPVGIRPPKLPVEDNTERRQSSAWGKDSDSESVADTELKIMGFDV